MTPDRRTLLALFAIAFGLRLLYAAVAGTVTQVDPVRVSFDYVVAEHIHDNLAWVGRPFTPSAPGYPMALALVFRILGVGLWRALIFNAALGAAMTFFLYRMGERRLGRNVGLFSALWLGLYIEQMHVASIVIRDTLAALLFLWFVAIAARPFHRMRSAVWAGCVYTALVFVEPMLLWLLPLVIAYFVLYATGHRILSLQYVFLFVSTVFVLNVPWTIRNYVVYGEPVVIALETSRYTPGAARGDEARSPVRETVEFWRVMRLHDAPADPATGARARPAWSLRHNLLSLISYGLLLPFALAGLIFAARRRQRAGLVLAGAIISYFLLRLLFVAGVRTRAPVEPLLILLAFYGASQLWAYASARRSRPVISSGTATPR